MPAKITVTRVSLELPKTNSFSEGTCKGIRRTKSRDSFCYMLNDQNQKISFRRFLMDCHSEELLNFLDSLSGFKATKSESESYLMATTITSMYLEDSSIYELNIPNDFKERVFAKLCKCTVETGVPRNIFDEIEKQVLLMMKNGFYLRFKKQAE